MSTCPYTQDGKKKLKTEQDSGTLPNSNTWFQDIFKSSEYLFPYPPGSVNKHGVLHILAEDQARLEPGELLNDNLCALLTKMIQMEEGFGARTPRISSSDGTSAAATTSNNVGPSVKILSSYFYTKLADGGTICNSWDADFKAFFRVR